MTARVPDLNGWYEIKNNPLSKAGVFQYLGSSIDADGKMGLDPGKTYSVYRPADELKHPECIESFKLLPWIDNHEMLGDGFTPAEEKGVEGVIGEDVFFDEPDQTLKGNIKVFSTSLMGDVDQGKTELSCGYRCLYRLEPGVFDGIAYDVIQHTIRGNHLASVDEGRMGPDVSVMDEAQAFTFTIDHKDFLMPKPDDKKPDDKKPDDTAEDAMSIEQCCKVMAECCKTMTECCAAMKSMTPKAADSDDDGKNKAEDDDKKDDKKDGKAMDAADVLADENQELKKQLDNLQATVDSIEADGMKTMLASISKRDALAKQLSDFVGVFDHSDMTLTDVAKYGVEKIGVKCEDGEEIAALSGFLHNREPSTQGFGLDGKEPGKSDTITNYLNGER